MKSRTVTILVAVMLILPAFGVAGSPSQRNSGPKVLFVCSDIGDVTLANSFGSDVDILYLGKDLPDDRSRLSNLLYLSRYDEIWIPDLNVEWTKGGRLNEDEINTLMEYVRSGGILVIGLNTYVQSWSRKLDELLGIRVMRLEKPPKDGESWDIVYKGRVYQYNDTYQAVVVRTIHAEVLATYRDGYPAITLNHYGSGVAVLMTFNPVKGYTNGDSSLLEVYRAVSSRALLERLHPPSVGVTIEVWIFLKEFLLNPVILGLFIFFILELLAYFGFMPLGLTVLFALPALPLRKFVQRKEVCIRTVEVISTVRGVTLSELSEEIGVNARRLKFCIALLQLESKVSVLNVSNLGEEEPLITIRGLESEGVASWAIERHQELMEAIAKWPGITILDLSRRVNKPPYEVFEFLRELSKWSVVEVRKMALDYEVYPTRALTRWFEE
jgi:hypothetical protein